MKLLHLFLFLFISVASFSQVSNMLGAWRTIDDKTGEDKSIVTIYQAENGKYYGKVDKLFTDPDKKCVNCKDANKNQPIRGMVIITDMKEKGDKLEGGYILDPASGDKYNVTITYDKATGNLKLRGSIDKLGLLGRNQYWVKEK
jgi:uncharacterized protein (DUF2147 family)